MKFNYDVLYLGPPSAGDTVYGLYEPIGDLFLAIGTDVAAMHELAFLFSSRYIMYVCCISTATNYQHRMIDNTVCHNWTLSNKQDFTITRFPDLYRVIQVDQLRPRLGEKPWNFDNDQKYLEIAHYYLTDIIPKLERREKLANSTYSTAMLTDDAARLKQRVESLPMSPFPNRHKLAIERIKYIIYSEFDVSKASTMLAQVKDSSPHLNG